MTMDTRTLSSCRPGCVPKLSCLLVALLALGVAACTDIESEPDDLPVGGLPVEPVRGSATQFEPRSFIDPFVPRPGQVRPFLPPTPDFCPALVPGVNRFDLPGIGSRDVELFFDPTVASRVRGAPLILFQHDIDATPLQVRAALSPNIVDQIRAGGGVIAAPFPGPSVGPFPGSPPLTDDDLALTDALVACLFNQLGLDPFRISALGVGVGGLRTAALAAERSNFIANAGVFGGGFLPGAPRPFVSFPDNPQPTMIFHGGPNDVLDSLSFFDAAELWFEDQTLLGRFSAICNTAQGRVIPTGVQDELFDFFLAHPFGTDPSPFLNQPRSALPAFCNVSRVAP